MVVYSDYKTCYTKLMTIKYVWNAETRVHSKRCEILDEE